jgi:hypothetical protein
MLFKVVPTHVSGKPRAKADMAAAEQFMGELTISNLETSSARRPVLVAHLKDPADRHGRSLQHPLFDARVVKITRAGLHLVGYQIETQDGAAVEVVQGWWAKSLQAPQGAP